MPIPLDLSFFMDLEADGGVKVRDYRLQNGHYLVFKIPMADLTSGVVPLVLPDIYKKRAVKNVVAIKGFVLRSSEPYCPVRAKTYWEWDEKAGQQMPKHKLKTFPQTEAEVRPGDCVLYSSYNIAHIAVNGLLDPLVIIREIDMLTVWDPKDDDSIQLSDHALDSLFQTPSDFNA
jgi:hypothetical protein